MNLNKIERRKQNETGISTLLYVRCAENRLTMNALIIEEAILLYKARNVVAKPLSQHVKEWCG